MSRRRPACDVSTSAVPPSPATDTTRNRALRFVLLIGTVSLFADMAYEGARGINGPFLLLLGASGAVVGTVAGLGELLAYGLRLLSGRWADRSRRYWTIAILGYALNMLAVPILALAGSWPLAALFMLLERTGKAIRNPPRDAMLSSASHVLGRGFTFGLHETLDRVGGTLGPLLAALVLGLRGQYTLAYLLLGIPAGAAMVTLLVARATNPRPHDLEPPQVAVAARGFDRRYWLAVAAGAFLAAGLVDFPLLAYHLGRIGTVPAAAIPVLYAFTNAVSGVGAFALGRAGDAWGRRRLAPLVLAPVLSTPLVLIGTPAAAIVGFALWGIGLGVVASLFKPLIASLVPGIRRATAFGTFDAAFGIAWFAGSALLGVLYDKSETAMAVLSALLVLMAFPLLMAATDART